MAVMWEIDLSKGLLPRIESIQVSPPRATFSKIVQGLDVHIGIFFEEGDYDRESYAVTHKNRRKQITRTGTKIGFTYYSLTRLKSHHAIEPFIVR
jgi:hypothetical protein